MSEFVLGEFTDRTSVLDLMYLIDELSIKNATFTCMGGLFSDTVFDIDIRELSAKLKTTKNDLNCIRGSFDKEEYFHQREPKWIIDNITTLPDYYNNDGLFIYGGNPLEDKHHIDINWLMNVKPSETVEYFLPTFPKTLGEIYPELYNDNVIHGDFNPYENAQSKLDYFVDSFHECDHQNRIVFFKHNFKFYYRTLNKNHYIGIPPNIILSTSFLYER